MVKTGGSIASLKVRSFLGEAMRGDSDLPKVNGTEALAAEGKGGRRTLENPLGFSRNAGGRMLAFNEPCGGRIF
jgi:hypothetical protein